LFVFLEGTFEIASKIIFYKFSLW